MTHNQSAYALPIMCGLRAWHLRQYLGRPLPATPLSALAAPASILSAASAASCRTVWTAQLGVEVTQHHDQHVLCATICNIEHRKRSIVARAHLCAGERRPVLGDSAWLRHNCHKVAPTQHDYLENNSKAEHQQCAKMQVQWLPHGCRHAGGSPTSAKKTMSPRRLAAAEPDPERRRSGP